MSTLEDFLTMDETAALLGVNRGTVYRMVADGRLSPHPQTIGRHVVYERAQVEALKRSMHPEEEPAPPSAKKNGVTPSLENFLTKDEAAELLGVNPNSIKRMVADGRLVPLSKVVGHHYLYERSQVEELKRTLYPDGMSFHQIATKYGVALNTVKSHFRRLRVRPIGHNKRVQSAVYDPAQVAEIARSLGWQENRTSGSLNRVHEAGATYGRS